MCEQNLKVKPAFGVGNVITELDFNPDLAKKTKVWYNFDTKSIIKVADNAIDLIQTAYSKIQKLNKPVVILG